jgi:hypothetical protein
LSFFLIYIVQFLSASFINLYVFKFKIELILPVRNNISFWFVLDHFKHLGFQNWVGDAIDIFLIIRAELLRIICVFHRIFLQFP